MEASLGAVPEGPRVHRLAPVGSVESLALGLGELPPELSEGVLHPGHLALGDRDEVQVSAQEDAGRHDSATG
jgi:hypothetical protein